MFAKRLFAVGEPLISEVGMLPAFIVDQLRERERRARHTEVQPVLELDIPRAPSQSSSDDESEGDRGVIIIQL